MASTEDFQRAGLYDPAVDAETGRAELLQWLADQGFSIPEMLEAFHGGGLGALAGDRRLVPGTRLSDAEALELTGLSGDQLETTAIAFGFARRTNSADSLDGQRDESATGTDFGLTSAEAEALVGFGAIAGMFSDEEALGFVRVVGSALGRIADAVVALFLTDVEGPYLATSADELALAKKVLGAVELLDDFVPLLDTVFRRHILQAIERSRLTVIDEQERLQYRYAVGFVDLVGFTPLSQEMSARELGVFIRDFEGKAHDVITAAGARLVKLIGDEVMFVAPDPDSACEVAEALMSGFTAENGREVLPRAGMAYGDVLVRGGDFYGDMVNLASRLADQAAPSELLVTRRFAETASCLDFDNAGHRDLKGFADPIEVYARSFEAEEVA